MVMQADSAPRANGAGNAGQKAPSSDTVPIAARAGRHPMKTGQWTEQALRVLRERYLARDGDAVRETPEEMCWRVAYAIAAAEERWGKSPVVLEEIARAFYDLMVEGQFLPKSPTLLNAGEWK